MIYSVEKLIHFQCQVKSCKKWFSIGDAPINHVYYCPWCGNKPIKLLQIQSNEKHSNNEIETLKNALRLAADEPNIDKARAIADAILYPVGNNRID